MDALISNPTFFEISPSTLPLTPEFADLPRRCADCRGIIPPDGFFPLPGKSALLALLFERGLSLDFFSPSTRTALLPRATQSFSSSELIGPLVQAGLDPNSPDSDGLLPLHHALLQPNPVSGRALLASGADSDPVFTDLTWFDRLNIDPVMHNWFLESLDELPWSLERLDLFLASVIDRPAASLLLPWSRLNPEQRTLFACALA